MGLRVRGRANIREEEPAVYVGNHASHYDLFIMLASLPAFQRGKLVVASWHRILEMRLLGPLLRGIDTVPVDPRTGSDAQRTLALRQLVNHVRQGRSVMIFPEGRRNDRLGEFGTGAALVAHQCGVPVAPFAIRGAQPLFKSVGWPDRWFGEVDVEFLPRFDPASVTAGMAGAPLEEKLAALTHEMRRRVAGAVDYPVDGPA
jgi:1-acyl-sn-glycerol-3-phosphate acyltransferase